MKCQAKIQDEFGGKYKCYDEAVTKLIITTFAPHLQRDVITTKCLCSMHLHRTKNRYNYRIKHLGKKCTLKEEPL